ncbi:potassium channel family protein [Evansella sp. AB-P1]|uniref:potassium channel family protein n=1 Tax=Evansella sp. AB-P1 TaxID=3037653 RepID=UPI00241DAA63|nr:potassium channel family protein [Evansella sp. AB-P1]MDG5790098.1 potassium channel family protein [Evansella sp. AB-P1]
MYRFDFILHSYSKLHSLLKMTAIVFLFVFIIGGIIHVIEPDAFPTIYDGVWWGVVTISTVGYGDFVPETVFGRFLGMVLIISGIALFSFFITNLASSTILSKQERDEGGTNYHKHEHVIIVGWNERSDHLIHQIQQINKNQDIVLIDETLQKKPEHFKRVTFIKGSPTVDETFRRANVKEGRTVIITSNHHIDEKSADANTVLSLLTVKGLNSNIYAIVEIMTDSQIKNAERAGADEIIQSSNYVSKLLMNGIINHGMTDVIFQMLNRGKEEHLYFKAVPTDLINESFERAIEDCQTKDSFLMGIRRDNQTILHPSKGSQLLIGDQLIFYRR